MISFNLKQILLFVFIISILLYNFSLLSSAVPSNTTLSLSSPSSHPNIFLNQNEINAIKAKVHANEEPWKSAYVKAISNADLALTKGPFSVTYQGDASLGDDLEPGHSPYCGWKAVDGKEPNCRDGQRNPYVNRGDYPAALEFSRTIRDLALGYTFTTNAAKKKAYADRVVKLIRVWTLDSSTKMNPAYIMSGPNMYGSWIDISITMPSLFYAADLIWNYPGWNDTEKNAFKAWTKELIVSAKTWQRDQNYENWRLVLISSASIIADDSANRTYAFNKWKELIPNQINTKGQMFLELDRGISLTYSTYALNAMIQTAEIARHNGVDLYSYRIQDGRGLELALDYHAPYVTNPSTWPYTQATSYSGDNAALYELAYSFKQKSSYMDVITKWGRPMYENRVMGSITLTHAFGAYPFDPLNATPTYNLTIPPNQNKANSTNKNIEDLINTVKEIIIGIVNRIF